MRNYLYSPNNLYELFTNAVICPGDMVPGATFIFDGQHLRVKKCGCGDNAGGADSAKVIALEGLLNEANQKIQDLTTRLVSLSEKLVSLESASQSTDKFFDVVFNGETEKTVNDSFITEDSIVDYTFLNGENAGEITTYAGNGSVTIKSTSAETGTFRVQITKKK